MFDSARCLERRDYYRKAVDFAAERGINAILWHFTDDQGCTLAFDSVPGIASPNAYSKSEMKRLIAYARERGITIIPELAALGHCRYITRLPEYRHLDEIEHVFTGMCPVAPEAREVLLKLLEEVVETFDSPWIHVGLDEANIGHHPLTLEALKTRSVSEIVADHINFLHEHVRRLGREMMMWGDGLLHDRAIAPRISRDIIVCDWQYAPTVTGETVQYFLDEGFRVVLCPALVCYQQPTFPGDQYAVANIQSLLRHGSRQGKGRVVGAIETIWQPERYMHDALWIGLDLACGFLQHGSDMSIEERTRQFAETFYGFTPDDAWVKACREMYRLAPLREEWLAVAKHDVAALPPAATLRGRALAWKDIVEAFIAGRSSVRKNRRAYNSFLLLVRVIRHLYRKALILQTRKPTTAQLCALAGREQRLLERAEAVWDRERFADDPKKYQPAREVMRDNHLLIVLRAAAERTKAELQRVSAPPSTPVAPVLAD